MPETRKTPHLRLACEVTADRVIAARAADRGDAVEAVSIRTLPAGAVGPLLSGTNVHDRGALRQAISDALAAVGGRSRDVIAVLPDAAVRVVLLDFDALPEREQEAASVVRFRLKKSVPFDVERSMLSYQAQRANGSVRVVAAVAARQVIEEYESAFREAGYSPGVVLPSAIAALGPVDASEPTLLVKVDATTTTLVLADQQELRLVRTLENPHGGNVDSSRLAADVYPSLVFFQDTYGTTVRQVLVTGLASAAQLRDSLEESGARVEDLSPARYVLSGLQTGPEGVLTGVVGALVS